MGVVYRAHDPLLGRDVAIKIVAAEMLTPEIETRLRREAQIVARLDHPAIITVHDIGRHEGALFVVMPVVPGVAMRTLMTRGALRLGDVLNLTEQIARALDYSHRQGVVHRDIKPENLLVDGFGDGDPRVRIMDFGLARVTSESELTRITRTGTILGTIHYFSPEQIAGSALIDGRADIYSLGVILYECLSGKPPFSGDPQSVLYRIVHEHPHAPRGVDHDLAALVLQCLAKRPDDRPSRAREVADRIASYATRLTDADKHLNASAGAEASSSLAHMRVSSRIPFLGRSAEITRMCEVLDRTTHGESRILAITGDAGIGKSRLVIHLSAAAATLGLCVLHGRFVEEDVAFPFQSFCEVIQDAFSKRVHTSVTDQPDLSQVASDLVRLFPPLAEISEIRNLASETVDAPPPAEIADRFAMVETLARAFGLFADAGPLVIVFEDVHRAGASLEALKPIAARLATTSTLLVVTYQPNEARHNPQCTRLLEHLRSLDRFDHISIGPLDPEEHRAFVELLSGCRFVADATAKRLYDATEGNPLFTRELVAALLDAGRFKLDDDDALAFVQDNLPASTLPATIQQAIEHRIGQLPDPLRDLLSTASVFGRSCDLDAYAAISPDAQDFEAAIEELVDSGLLARESTPSGQRVAFTSTIVRDVLYSELSRRRRRALHRQIAEYLETRNAGRIGRVVQSIAHHYAEAGIGARAIEYGIKAAQQSLDAFKAEDAESTLRIVLSFLDDDGNSAPETEAEARMLTARAYRQQGRIEAAIAEARTAAGIFTSANDSARAASAWLLAAEAAWTGRMVDDARLMVGLGIANAREVDAREELIRLLTLGATLAGLAAESDLAEQYFREIDELKDIPSTMDATIGLVERGGSVRIPAGPDSSFDRLDPALITTDQQADIFACVFETLTLVVEGARVVPWLAADFTTEDGGRRFRFQLRENVSFHDGRPLTTRDVKYSYERLLRTAGSKGSGLLADIHGAQAYAAGEADELAGLRIVSNTEFVIELDHPIAFFPVLLTDPSTSILPEGHSPMASTWRDGCVGTGPFRLKSLDVDHQVVLEPNPFYWREGYPRCDELVFELNVLPDLIYSEFRAGTLSLANTLQLEHIEILRHDPEFARKFREMPSLSTSFLAFNVRRGPLADERLRHRVVAAVDVLDIVRRTMIRLTTPANSLIPPNLLGHSFQRPPAPPRYRGGEREDPVTLTAALSPAFNGRLATVRDALCETLDRAGIRLEIKGVWLQDLKDAHLTGEVDMILTTWAADYPDADNFAYGLMHTSNGQLGPFCGIPDIDLLAEEARAEGDPHARHLIYRKIEEVIERRALLLPLFHPQKYRFARPEVEGLTITSLSFPVVAYERLWARNGPSG